MEDVTTTALKLLSSEKIHKIEVKWEAIKKIEVATALHSKARKALTLCRYDAAILEKAYSGEYASETAFGMLRDAIAVKENLIKTEAFLEREVARLGAEFAALGD